MDMTFFEKGSSWEADQLAALERSRVVAWRIATAACVLVGALALAIASLTPLRRTVPYLVRVDSQTGALEVLQPFDNRSIGRQELMDMYWASRYVLAREQYNWWLVGGDYDFVMRTTASGIASDYASQFQGPKALDKVFGEYTERRINILSVTPAPTVQNQMVVRFERTTMTKGILAEPPTVFVVTMSFRYQEKVTGAVKDLMRNPMGFEVFAYRRDAEVGAPRPSAPASSATTGAAA